ncbi:hypothetical protein SUGI_1016990 [Cryptomeria japonica]|nr:hypothetical protein SUGI_1016990 [Cryptomeria japonica]
MWVQSSLTEKNQNKPLGNAKIDTLPLIAHLPAPHFQTELEEDIAKANSRQARTTVMIRNIPNVYRPAL